MTERSTLPIPEAEGERLDDSQRMLSTLISNLPGLVYRCRNDPDWTMVFASEGCEALTGYPASDLTGSREISYGDLVHPDDRDWLWAKCQASLDRREPCRNEYRIVTRSGAVKWVWEQARGLHGDDGALLAIEGCIMDITDRKHAEQALRTAMGELDHRVKNNLAAVIALANQTKASSHSLAEFTEIFTGRIHAMALGHAALSAARWQGVELGSIVRQTLAPCDRARVEIEGAAMILPARTSGPLTMTLHELATNAMKYGALSGSAGHVSIRWKCGSDHILHLDWRETGGPAVVPPAETGLGISLVRGFIDRELHGSVELDFDPAGVRCRLAVPLEPETPSEVLSEVPPEVPPDP